MSYGADPFGGTPFGALGGPGLYSYDLTTGFVPAAVLVAHRVVSLVAAWAPAAQIAQVRRIVSPVEGVQFEGASASTHHGLEQLSADSSFVDVLSVVYRIIVTDGLDFEAVGESSRRQIIAAVDQLVATGTVTSRHAAVELVTAALTLQDMATRGWRIEQSSEVAFQSTLVQTLRRVEALVSAIVYADVLSSGARFTLVLADGVQFDAAATSTARMFELLTSSLAFGATLRIGNEEFVAWMVNTEGANAASRYDNFGFNSFAEFDGHYYGAMVDGLYALEGSDDAGADIKAQLLGGLTTFGTRAKKRLPMGYVHCTTDGALLVQVIAFNDANQKEVFWYELDERGTGVGRVEPDGGIESVHYGWRLLNVDGADFSIDSIGFVPLALNRRV